VRASIVCALGILAWSTLGLAQQRTPSEASHDLGLVISGGVSLGSYEAGYLYLTGEALKHTHGRYRARLFTGASAGSANALIGAIESCRAPNSSPLADPGYQAWVEVGYRELFDPATVGPTHIFTRAPLQRAIERLRRIYLQGLPDDCDVVVGVSTTRTHALPVRLHGGLRLPRLSEKFAVRIRGRGLGRPPHVSNYVDPSRRYPQALVPLVDDAELAGASANFSRLAALIYASSAFPVAFAPQRLGYCMARTGHREDLRCRRPRHFALFADGGILDNNPLRLAHRLARTGLRRDASGRSFWRNSRAPTDTAPPYRDLVYTYVDPDTDAYPALPAPESANEQGMLGLLGQLLGEFVDTARSQELYDLAEASPELMDRLMLTYRHFPTASALLGAFLGFFERELRRFDFYLGMYDAYAQTAQVLHRFGDETLMEGLLSALAPAFARGSPATMDADMKPFACMLSVYEANAERLHPACAGDDMREFRILLQVSLDRLYEHCAKLPSDRAPLAHQHYHCHRAASGERVPRVVPAADSATDRRTANEGDYDYVMRLLAGYDFHFRDLGLDASDASDGGLAIRRELGRMVSAVARAQPDLVDRIALLTAGRLAVNSLSYDPPRHFGYVAIGNTFELGAAVSPFELRRRWLRVALSLRADGLRTLIEPDSRAVSLTPAVGVEAMFLPWAHSTLTTSIGLRGGWRFATRDHFGARACDERAALSDARNCSQPVVQAYLVFALLERLRLAVGASAFPVRRAFDRRRAQLDVAFGLQLF